MTAAPTASPLCEGAWSLLSVYNHDEGSITAQQWKRRYLTLLDSQELHFHKRIVDLTLKSNTSLNLRDCLHVERCVVNDTRVPSSDDIIANNNNNNNNHNDHDSDDNDERVSPTRMESQSLVLSFAPDWPWGVRLILANETWCIRFADSALRDKWFQRIEVYTVDHFDFTPLRSGHVLREIMQQQDFTWQQVYLVITTTYILLFDTQHTFEKFMVSSTRVPAQAKLRLLPNLAVVVLPIRFLTSDNVTITQATTAATVSNRPTFKIACVDEELQLCAPSIDERKLWIRTLNQCIDMFQHHMPLVSHFVADGPMRNDEVLEPSMHQVVKRPAIKRTDTFLREYVRMDLNQLIRYLRDPPPNVVLLKHGRWGKPHTRSLRLTHDDSRLSWKIGSPYSYVLLDDIHNVHVGCVTPVFQKSQPPPNQSHCFSIMTRDRSVDFEAPGVAERDFYVSSIRLLCNLK